MHVIDACSRIAPIGYTPLARLPELAARVQIRLENRYMTPLNVLLINRSQLFRAGVASMLEAKDIHVATDAGTAEAALAALDEIAKASDDGAVSPRLAIMEWPGGKSDAELRYSAQKIKGIAERMPVIVMAPSLCRRQLLAALNAGARGFLLQDIGANALGHYCRLALLGEIVLPSDFKDSVISEFGNDQCVSLKTPTNLDLSDRDIELLFRVAHGDSNKSIARFMDIPEPSVKAKLRALMRKIGVINRTQAAIWSHNHGIVKTRPGNQIRQTATAAIEMRREPRQHTGSPWQPAAGLSR
jgi:two-component system, NarL family, nitrate/nitrite response regulator NarL